MILWILIGLGFGIAGTSMLLENRKTRKNKEATEQQKYNRRRFNEDLEKIKGVKTPEKVQEKVQEKTQVQTQQVTKSPAKTADKVASKTKTTAKQQTVKKEQVAQPKKTSTPVETPKQTVAPVNQTTKEATTPKTPLPETSPQKEADNKNLALNSYNAMLKELNDSLINYRKALISTGRPNISRVLSVDSTIDLVRKSADENLNPVRKNDIEVLFAKFNNMNSVTARNSYEDLVIKATDKSKPFTKMDESEMNLAAAAIYKSSHTVPEADLRKVKVNKTATLFETAYYENINELRKQVDKASALLEKYKVALLESNPAKNSLTAIVNLEVLLNNVYLKRADSLELNYINNMMRNLSVYNEAVVGKRIDEIRNAFKNENLTKQHKIMLINELLLIDAYTYATKKSLTTAHKIIPAKLRPVTKTTINKARANNVEYKKSKKNKKLAPKTKTVAKKEVDVDNGLTDDAVERTINVLLARIANSHSIKEREGLIAQLQAVFEVQKNIVEKAKKTTTSR